MVSVDVKHHVYLLYNSDRAGVSERNLVIRRAIPMTELRICVQVEVDVLGSPSLIVRTDSAYIKQHLKKKKKKNHRAQELCESRGGHHGLLVPNSPYGPRGRKATPKKSNSFGSAVVNCPVVTCPMVNCPVVTCPTANCPAE